VAASAKSIPCVKGSLFWITHANLLRLVERGKITREELDVRLTPEQIELLDAKIQVALWYPIDAFETFLRIASEVGGGSSHEQFAKAGRMAAEKLAESGLYAQLSEDARSSDERAGRRLVTLGSAFYNFMHWKFIPGDDPTHFTIDVTDAAAWCEELRYITEGFIEVVSSRSIGRPLRITSERVAPDHVVFHGRPGD
jgi:hypothetical protein